MAQIKIGFDVAVVRIEVDGAEQSFVGKVIRETPEGFSVAVMDHDPDHEDSSAGKVTIVTGMRHANETAAAEGQAVQFLRLMGEHWDIVDEREADARAAAALQPADPVQEAPGA